MDVESVTCKKSLTLMFMVFTSSFTTFESQGNLFICCIKKGPGFTRGRSLMKHKSPPLPYITIVDRKGW